MTTKITKAKKLPGSQERSWNVDRDGVPYGAIWMFPADLAKTHHAKALNGDYAFFDNTNSDNPLADAKEFMTD